MSARTYVPIELRSVSVHQQTGALLFKRVNNMGRTGENSCRQRGRICLLHSGTAYDVTEFSKRHPGGREWLQKYSGQDVSQVMQEPLPHRHSEAAYAILQKYRIVQTNDTKQISLPGSQNGGFHLYHSTKDDDHIDWTKPILLQVSGLKEHYFEWVHQPVDIPLRLFQSEFLEFFSRCPWWLVPALWIPTTIFLLHLAYSSLSSSDNPVIWSLLGADVVVTPAFMPGLIVIGVLLWTFCEYSIHRWLFHMCPPSDWPFLITLHFILHGQHHKSPMDRTRLVFPPIPASIFAAIILSSYHTFSPWPVAQTLFAGTVLGYMVYDLTHYYIHHGTPIPFYFANLKRYHVKHHFENQQLGFGISSKLWDYPFGTLIPDIK